MQRHSGHREHKVAVTPLGPVVWQVQLRTEPGLWTGIPGRVFWDDPGVLGWAEPVRLEGSRALPAGSAPLLLYP